MGFGEVVVSIVLVAVGWVSVTFVSGEIGVVLGFVGDW